MQSLSKDEKAIVKEVATPNGWKLLSGAKRTPTRTKKHSKSFFGYKLSASADKRYKLIRKIKVCTASEHDTLHLEDVLDPCNTSRDVYADNGYVNGKREVRLTGEGWRMHTQRKGSKENPLSEAQERRNRRIAKPRARVELFLPAWPNWAAKCCAQ